MRVTIFLLPAASQEAKMFTARLRADSQRLTLSLQQALHCRGERRRFLKHLKSEEKFASEIFCDI